MRFNEVTMAKKAELGEKRVCPECEAKFYDLTRNPATCPMCQHSFDPAELEPTPILPLEPLAPEKDDDEDGEAKEAVDEDDIDEDETAAKELELDGDDVAVIGGTPGDNEDKPEFDGFQTDEDEDADAALVDDEDDNVMPPPDDADDDDVEEVEI